MCISLSIKGKKWFGDDGRIMALPDPIKESSTRPPLFNMEEDLDPALQTVYRKVRTHARCDSHFDQAIHLPHLKQRAHSYSESVVAPSDLSGL